MKKVPQEDTLRSRMQRLLTHLIESGKVRSANDLCQKAGYQSGSALYKLFNTEDGELQMSFVYWLHQQYGVCLNWLIYGYPHTFNLAEKTPVSMPQKIKQIWKAVRGAAAPAG